MNASDGRVKSDGTTTLPPDERPRVGKTYCPAGGVAGVTGWGTGVTGGVPGCGTGFTGVPGVPGCGTGFTGVPGVPGCGTGFTGVPGVPGCGTGFTGVPGVPGCGTGFTGVPGWGGTGFTGGITGGIAAATLRSVSDEANNAIGPATRTSSTDKFLIFISLGYSLRCLCLCCYGVNNVCRMYNPSASNLTDDH